MKKTGEILETIAIYLALISLFPVILWWHKGNLGQQRGYYIYLFFLVCIMGFVAYRRIKKLRAALKASKKQSGSGRPMPPFFR